MQVPGKEAGKEAKGNGLKRIGLTAAGVLALVAVAAFGFYGTEIKSALKLVFRLTPVHAKHIPRSALTVTRTNLAAIALKAGLGGENKDPAYLKMVEYGTKLYPRFEQLMANPVKETGIELAEDAYLFTELLDERTPAYGVLFGLSDHKRFAEFIQRIRPGSHSTEGGVSLVRLDEGASLYWNDSFALIYGGVTGERLSQRAKALMALTAADSIKEDPVKKKWLEGKDDILASVDLERITRLPELGWLMTKSPFKMETYLGSTLGFAINFEKGRCVLETRATGTAMVAQLKKSFVPPGRDFLAGIPVDNYQALMATHLELAPLLESVRQADPESFRKANDLVTMLTDASLEQLSDSFTGDICLVLENIQQQTIEQSRGWDFFGNPLPPVSSTKTVVDGTAAVGVKPESAVLRLLEKSLAKMPGNAVSRDGKLYRIRASRDSYLLADNGYLALSTRKEAAHRMATYARGGQAVMDASLLERAGSAVATVEIKLPALLPSLAAAPLLPSEARTGVDLAASRLSELRLSSRVEQDVAATQMEIHFKDQTRNSLNQITELSVATVENAFAQYRLKACNSAALTDLRNARTAMEAYFADNQRYPESLTEIHFQPSSGVELTCRNAPHGYACVSKHSDGDRLYATLYSDAGIRTRQCGKTERPEVPLGSVYEALERL